MHTFKPRAVLALASLMILSACASDPSACQPPMPKPAPVPVGPSFQDRMRLFLSGKLPEPISYELTSPGAKVKP